MNRRSINLLTWRFRIYLLIRARLVQWSVIWAGCSLILMGWWQVENHRLGTARDAMAIMENRCTPVQQMQNQNVVLAKRVSELRSHQSLLTRLDDEQVPFRLLGLLSQKVADCSGAIRVDSLAIDRRLEPETAAANPTRSTPASTTAAVAAPKSNAPRMREVTALTLSGMADDNITVAQFVGLLRDSGVFETVELVSSIGADTATQRGQTYLVKCVL